MATENLKVKITADASQAKAEIGRFKDTLKKTTSEAEGSSSKMSALRTTLDTLKNSAKENIAAHAGVASSLGKIAIAAGSAAVALKTMKALIGNAVDVAATGDAIKDEAQKVFMSTTAYQEWGYVLQQNGIEISALKMGMRKFAQEVAAGSDTLAKYGITAKDVDTAFQQAVYTIQNMSSETDKIAAATELFGARALELFPILNLTNAETQSLMYTYRAIGGTMSNELLAASDVCTDSILEMRMAWGGLRNLLAAYVIPVVTKVVQWITVAIAKIRILLAAILGVKETFGGGGKKSLPATSGSVAKNIGNTAGNLKKAAKHAKELRRTLMGIDELTRLVEQATAAAAASPSGGGGGGSVGDVGVGDVGSFDGVLSQETLDKIEAFRQKIEDIKDKLHGGYLILKGLTELAFGKPVQGFKDIWDGLQLLFPGLKTLGEKWDEMKEKWEGFKKAAAEKVIEFATKFKDGVTAGWEKLKKWWDALTTKAKEYAAKFVEGVKEGWNKLKKWWDEKKDQAKDFKAEFVEKVKDKFEKLRTWWKNKKVSAKKFKTSFVDGVKEKWNKLKAWWNNLKGGEKSFSVKFGFVDKLRSGWNSLAGKINAAREKSTIVKALIPYIQPLARGGVLTAPTTALMGEYAGARTNPEIATPQSLMYETIQRANGDMVSAFASMTRQVIAAIEDKDLSVSIGDEQIARSAQRGNSAYYNRTGRSLITT